MPKTDKDAGPPLPFGALFAEVQEANPKWRVEVGQPEAGAGWIRGTDFFRAGDGPFHSLLGRIGERLRTRDRRTVAALFTLRFGWVASAAITPFLTHGFVPHVGLSNISIKFREDTLFERIAVHEAAGMVLGASGIDGLLRQLRSELVQQAQPVVESLFDWSGFSRKGAWGMIASAWASQFIEVCGRRGNQMDALPFLVKFSEGADELARMMPRLNPVTLQGVTHLYQRRASCCRYYLLEQGDLCASCPLVSDEDRTKRNIEFMEKQLSRAAR
jgi:ferric iron reductase protein FhuF